MALRRSLEDCELLAMVRKAGQKQVAENAHERILTNRMFNKFHDEWNTYLTFEEMSEATYQDYEQMREDIFRVLN